MFRNLLNRLLSDGPGSGALSRQDSEIAIAALMVRVARADDHYHDSERAMIDTILARHNALSPDQAAERRAAAEMIEAEAPDTVRFTRQIKDRVPLEDRHAVIANLWEVALAHDGRGGDEDAMIRLTAQLLGVNDRDSALARQRVVGAMGQPGN